MAKTHMSIAEFLKTPEWARLSVRQQTWLRTYLASDDQILAVQNAYYNVSLKNVRAFSYKIRKQKKIQAALDKYFTKSPRQIFIDRLESQIKRARSGSVAKALLQQALAATQFGPSKKSKSKEKIYVRRKPQ